MAPGADRHGGRSLPRSHSLAVSPLPAWAALDPPMRAGMPALPGSAAHALALGSQRTGVCGFGGPALGLLEDAQVFDLFPGGLNDLLGHLLRLLAEVAR